MRKAVITTVVLALVFAFSGLVYAIHVGDDESYKGQGEGQIANGPNMWKNITEDNPYTKWDLWPGTDKMFQGTEPHGAYLTVYVTKGARQTIEGKKGRFSQGAIIVKENYKPDKTLAAITVMYKAKGYNPEAGDWFWAKYQPDGTIDAAGKDASGKVDGCIQCHSKASDNDWVFTGQIK